MHTYKILTDPAELDKHLVPIFQDNGSEIPPSGCYVAAVEFDENGVVVGYQLAQNAVFLEGLWTREGNGHPLALYRKITEHLKSMGISRWLTITQKDEQGGRIGKLAKILGFTEMPWTVYRRTN